MKLIGLSGLATLLMTCTFGTASAQPAPEQVRDIDSAFSSWRLVDRRTGGFTQITAAVRDPFGGRGALEQTIPEANDWSFKSEIEIWSPDTTLEPGIGLVPSAGGFGRLADLQDLLVAWYRDGASTTWPWIGPAIRVHVYDPDLGIHGSTSSMVWEPVYSGYATGSNQAVPVDQWVHSRLDDEIFWRQPLYIDGERVPRDFCSVNPGECHRYLRLSEWDLGPNTVIIGFSIAAGSGWPGTYHGFVDLLSLEMAGQPTTTWDFEPAARSRPRGDRHRGRGHGHR